MTQCRHCQRLIIHDPTDGWVDPEADGDDIMWRETCDEHDTFEARHEPDDEGPMDDDWIHRAYEAQADAQARRQTTSEMMLEDLALDRGFPL